jgi:hypothetical protein
MIRPRHLVFGFGGLVLVAQLVRPAIDNPPVVAEPHWNSARTREMVRGACFDCHSNETVVPWYGQVAPFRWLIAHHVQEGRGKLNFSDPSSEYDLDDMAKELHSGGMPIWDYKLAHPMARLTDAQRDSLVVGLKATFGRSASIDDSATASTDKSAVEESEERGEKGGEKD